MTLLMFLLFQQTRVHVVNSWTDLEDKDLAGSHGLQIFEQTRRKPMHSITHEFWTKKVEKMKRTILSKSLHYGTLMKRNE